MANELDDLDRRILRALQTDNRSTFQELADIVNSSAASCLRRVKKLREMGAITADVALINPDFSSKKLTVIITVNLENERLDLLDSFKRTMTACEEVLQCYMVTGDADFVVIVMVEDMDAFDRFINSKLYSNPNIRKFTSMISVNRVKFDPRVQI